MHYNKSLGIPVKRNYRKMQQQILIIVFVILCFVSVGYGYNLTESCTINEFSQVDKIVKSCKNIVVENLSVPAGNTLNLHLQTGSTLTFKGKTTFGSGVQWDGPLISISGQGIHVYGASGSVLDGQGPHYWDGKGGSGTRKPRFIKINANGGSTFQGIHLLNCPINCVSLSGSKDMTIRGWNIDCSAGDKNALGHNTDGFDMSSVENIIIENSVVKNQDDCVAVNYGKNLHISNLNCSGGHGLSLSVGMNKIDPSVNVVSNVTFTDCSVTHSRNGIHVKTHRDGTTGYISDVTYNNIHLSSISYYGVNVQQDYQDGGSTGHAGNNIQIKNLNLHNVQGTMTGSSSMPVYILCGSGSCSNFNWNEVSITGNKKHSSCNYHPNGYTCK